MQLNRSDPEARPHHPEVLVVLWRIDEALRLAAAVPTARIRLFVDSWGDVDEARRLACNAGSHDRLSVHHASARQWFRN